MEKKTMFALVALVAAVSASADTFDFVPRTSVSRYDWTTKDWQVNKAYVDRLPTKDDNAWLTSTTVRNSEDGMFINSGTAAEVARLYLANTSTNAKPMKLTIDGGSLTAYGRVDIAQKSPAILTVQNGGAFTSTAQYLYFGTANTDTTKVTVFDAKVSVDGLSSFTVSGTDTYFGNQLGGLALFENHGTVNFNSTASAPMLSMGYYPNGLELGSVTSVIDNYGTITASDNFRCYIGGTSGATGIITNHVGALIDKAAIFSVGSSSNSVGYLVNAGRINVKQFDVGGNTTSSYARNSDPAAFAEGWVENSGTISTKGWIRIGFQTNCVGHVENTGAITGGTECVIGYYPGSRGYLRHSAGTLVITNTASSVTVGYEGRGYLELAGNTETVFDKCPMVIASNDANETGKYQSYGELVITNAASLSLGGKNLWAGAYKHSTARIALHDDAKLSDIGTLCFGNVKTDNSFEMYGNSVVSNVNLLVLNAGSSSRDVSGTTTMKLSDNARICGLKNAYIGSNHYNRVELEIADNAWLELIGDAGETNVIKVAPFDDRVGDATIRMRGGTINLGYRGRFQLGDTSNVKSDGCPAKLIGYGCFTNQTSLTGTRWSRIDIRSSSVTADGEGVERDLDLRTFARISGTVTEGRGNLNSSGTNGWYAINKGRLLYPARDGGESGSRTRFVGDYARLAAGSTAPKYVNSMEIIAKDSSGTELTTGRNFFVELYAPDRTDIPAGLVADGDRSRRLGVWRGCMATKYENTERRSYSSATATIRYDQWRLSELADAQGNYPAGLEVRLYRYDGNSGKWQRIVRYPAEDAAENGYLISGDLKPADGVYNLGWFAVVAECAKGTTIVLQ